MRRVLLVAALALCSCVTGGTAREHMRAAENDVAQARKQRADQCAPREPAAAEAFMYARLPPKTARVHARRLRPVAPPADEFPLSGPPEVRTVLIYATEDEFFEPAFERAMARDVLGVEPIEIPGGHFPMLEDPEALADLFDSLARG